MLLDNYKKIYMNIKIQILILLFASCFVHTQGQEAFYLSPKGNDAHVGSLKSPFKTLEKARDAMRNSTIKTAYLRAGLYVLTETFTLEEADNGTKWATYPADPINAAVIEGRGLKDVIDILGGSNIVIDGLTIRNFTSRGIGVHGGAGWPKAKPFFDQDFKPAANNIVRNNIVENGNVASPGWDRAAINIEGTTPNTMISNNVVRNTSGYGIGVWSLQKGDNISGTVIKNNAVLNTCTAANDGAAIYICDRTAASNPVIIENNFVRDYGLYKEDLRAIYLDDLASNTLVRGNILSGTGTQPVLVHGGNHNIISGNIIDIGAGGKQCVMNYAGRGAAPMIGNKFYDNVIISSYKIDSAGGAYRKFGKILDPEIMNNLYYNYSTGTVNTGGIFYKLKDLKPVTFDPGLSGWTYTMDPESKVYQQLAGFIPITRKWGPPGYTVPQTGTAPSCLLPVSVAVYCHAESFNEMKGVTKNGMATMISNELEGLLFDNVHLGSGYNNNEFNGMAVSSCDAGDWLRFNDVDFGTGFKTFTARLAVANAQAGKSVEVRLGSPDGQLIAALKISGTRSYTTFQEQSTTLSGGKGVQTVYIVFTGGPKVANFDYFKFH